MSMPGNANLSLTDSVPSASPSQPGRSVLVAVLLSLLVPGLGHVYGSRALRGAVLFAIALVTQAIVVLQFAGATPRFWPIAVSVLVWVAIVLFASIEAAMLARKAQHYTLRSYNKWYVYAGALAVAAAINVGVCLALSAGGAYPVRTFSILSSSMEPTIERGERLFAGMGHYQARPPARGDVVIYRHPKQTSDIWVKRIIAIEGERVMMRDGDAIVNGARIEEPYVRVGDRASMYANTREVVVPAGFVFVLGDNRANSTDSRVAAHGLVPVANLIGRATDIAWSSNLRRIGRWVGTPR